MPLQVLLQQRLVLVFGSMLGSSSTPVCPQQQAPQAVAAAAQVSLGMQQWS
jgi:Tfp pilus assembly protein PilF